MLSINKTAVKMVFFMIVILFSLMSGALIHAYAGSNSDQHTTADGLDKSGLAPSSQAVTVKSQEAVVHKASVDVCPGDTLWEIAAAHLPKGESVRSYMDKIKKANRMKNADLRAGQILIMP